MTRAARLQPAARTPERDRRLLERAPRVYLGPGALPWVTRVKGLLLGAKRPGWVDVVALQPWPKASAKELIALRFSQDDPLSVVGVVLTVEEVRRHRSMLLRELVPGDVVLGLPERESVLRGYVHCGDILDSAPIKRSRYAAIP